MNNNRSVSAAIGEYLVLGELLKRNIEAYLAHGETQKGWDVVIVTNESTRRLQVKTIDWPNQLAVNGNFADGFDYLVVVLLDRKNPRSRFFVFEHGELDALLSTPNGERRDGKRTLTMSLKSIESRVKLHEDNWEILLPSPRESRQDVLHA
ncbi:hypothetical protein [Burkholderia cepacia]|uniref:hypothetical protein n=1 Tax=Burkholderia cepacia TaxID=292 RepID=UPI0010FD6773|nr:hypothetical protein [Burkholderia cepacia]MCA7936412.1 hypothetical protein [Burkholderia cepacia]MCA8467836.1 hypothetical protein [Burkholderia cepacia]MDN7611954.1 hypothetical protein [Burkholderia cepacia]MDN7765564.1 hypothetical protein [Burkholderia cepacia]MDN7912893.1 hypothetical protein [Burkholderia cepacia]